MTARHCHHGATFQPSRTGQFHGQTEPLARDPPRIHPLKPLRDKDIPQLLIFLAGLPPKLLIPLAGTHGRPPLRGLVFLCHELLTRSSWSTTLRRLLPSATLSSTPINSDSP